MHEGLPASGPGGREFVGRWFLDRRRRRVPGVDGGGVRVGVGSPWPPPHSPVLAILSRCSSPAEGDGSGRDLM